MSYKSKYNVVNLCEVLRNEIPEYSQDETTIHDDSCNAINSQYGTYIDFNNKYTCQQVMYILNSISSVPESEHNDDKCKYLYYWTYQRSLQKNINYDVALNLYRSFLNTYFVDHTDPHICKNYMLPTKDIILKRSAKLIELYDIINKNSHQFDCTCAKKCSDLYISYLGECQNDYDYDCCSELQSFKYKYDKNMESIDKCEGGKKILPSAIKHDLHVIIIIPMIIVTILSFLVFALYKFTPIGSRITNRKRRKNVFLENQFNRSNTIPPTARTRRTEQNIAYNIAYDSTTYS